MYCVGCGQPLAADARFCAHCGAAVQGRRAPHGRRLWIAGLAALAVLVALAFFIGERSRPSRPAGPPSAVPAATNGTASDWSGLPPDEARAARRALEDSVRAEEAAARVRIDATAAAPGTQNPTDRKPPP